MVTFKSTSFASWTMVFFLPWTGGEEWKARDRATRYNGGVDEQLRNDRQDAMGLIACVSKPQVTGSSSRSCFFIRGHHHDG